MCTCILTCFGSDCACLRRRDASGLRGGRLSHVLVLRGLAFSARLRIVHVLPSWAADFGIMQPDAPAADHQLDLALQVALSVQHRRPPSLKSAFSPRDTTLTRTVLRKIHEYCELFMIIRHLSIQSHDNLGAAVFKLMINSACCIQTQLIVFICRTLMYLQLSRGGMASTHGGVLFQFGRALLRDQRALSGKPMFWQPYRCTTPGC